MFFSPHHEVTPLDPALGMDGREFAWLSQRTILRRIRASGPAPHHRSPTPRWTTAWRRCSLCLRRKPTQARTVKTHRFPFRCFVSPCSLLLCVHWPSHPQWRRSLFLFRHRGQRHFDRSCLTPHVQQLRVAEHDGGLLVPSLGVELGPGWLLLMDTEPSHKAKKALECTSQAGNSSAVKTGTTHARHSKRRTHTHTHTKTDTFPHSAGIGRVIFQSACRPDLSPLHAWAWNGIKREMFTVRYRTKLKAEAARAWAAVRSWQIPERLLRDWEERPASCVAAKGVLFLNTYQQTRSHCE